MSDNFVSIKRALISVSDKNGLLDLARRLLALKVEIISTGGTARYLRDAKISVTDITSITEFPELLDGRLKTLHPKIQGGILSVRDNPKHTMEMEEFSISAIDLVVVNLYPFEKSVNDGDDYTRVIENIDIGGPTLIRAAAKNYKYVSVLVEKADYEPFLKSIEENNGCSTFTQRENLAKAAFTRTAEYDAKISQWMLSANEFLPAESDNVLPRKMIISAKLVRQLRYGENPHQRAAYYRTSLQGDLLTKFVLHQGKDLSFNNITDINCALGVLAEFQEETGVVAAIIKHGNTCGVALKASAREAYLSALHSDKSSAFGGIVVINQKLDKETAIEISEVFTEIVLVPEVHPEASKILSSKKNLRIITWPRDVDFYQEIFNYKQVWGGLLLQEYDREKLLEENLSVVTNLKPSVSELDDLLFAWKVAKHIKSNSIVLAKNSVTVGIGAGQMSRVDSTRIAVMKSEDRANQLGDPNLGCRGAVAASDAFFPFPDGIFALASAGVSSVIQPGGSLKDKEVIDAANKSGISMVFTNVRHFNH